MADPWLGRTVLGRYRLRKKLGEGGMSVAYLADGGGHHVVVKFPNTGGRTSINICIDKLRVEGEILERIWRQYGGHPNIVRFVDRGDEGQYPVVVEEYVQGQTLAEYAAGKGGLDPDEAFEIGRKLADVLRFLHSHGIIHRDFAADNVIVRGTDPVLIDFGTAKEGYAQLMPGTRIEKDCVSPPEQSIGYAYFSSDVYMWASMLMAAMKPRRGVFSDAKYNFCRYIKPQHELIDEPCNLVECGGYVALFNKVFKAALEVDPTKRIKDGTELYNLLAGKLPPTPTGAYLLINGKRVQLDINRTYILGTEGSGADIEVPDPELRRSGRRYISRQHARIWYDKSRRRWLIQDLGSVNGTKIIRGGQEVVVSFGCRDRCPGQPSQPHELVSGDQIVLAFSASTGTPYVAVEFYE
ncbi:MAG: protein kinase [Thermoproteus sp.]